MNTCYDVNGAAYDHPKATCPDPAPLVCYATDKYWYGDGQFWNDDCDVCFNGYENVLVAWHECLGWGGKGEECYDSYGNKYFATECRDTTLTDW